jgi:hexosaminidase
MKKILVICLSQLFCAIMFFGQSISQQISIIPEPVSMVKSSGKFVLPATVTIETGRDAAVKKIADSLSKQIATATGIKVIVSSQVNTASTLRLLLNSNADNTIGEEGYTLDVSQKNVVMKANKPAGLFYAVQSFLQLLPKEISARSVTKNINWSSPCVAIKDYPRFGWRGLMFDVSRHFFTKQDVKDFIDEMVMYKYNLLHLHLTDDEGWRIEIKSLPNLTKVGAWNVRRTGTFGEFAPPAASEPRDYGGFYTQDDIREIVQYAKNKYVNILPEVDIPGHSLATISSYPELSCTPGAENYRIRSGEEIMDWGSGKIKALVDNTLCPANEKVYSFLDKVFTEVASLFPFEYIHIGGDECAKNFWEQSDAVKQLMQKEGLKNMEEVQSYFEKRVEKIVESKGKKVIGWDEILEGGLAPNAAVMSWRGIKGGIEAAKLGHKVVMTPTTFAYLDFMQGDKQIEPPVYATLRLNIAYSFEPVPEGVDAKFIMGGQGNLWTEQVYNTRHMQYMLWPRSLAIAECLWSPKEKKNWDGFVKKVETNFDRMDERNVKYSRAMFDAIVDVKKDSKDSLQITLGTEIKGIDIYYSFDNSNPDNFYPKYSSALSIPKQAFMLKIITYRNGKPVGRQLDIPVTELRKRIRKS